MKWLLGLALCGLSALAGAADGHGPTPVGIWQTFGDDGGEAEARVQIIERNGVLEGRITTLFARPDVSPDARCDRCTGSRKGEPVQGMTILTGARRVGDEYRGGEILDPESGDVYRCTLKLSPDNRRLTVRGYVGLTLFGRSQTWLRE